MYCVKGYDFTTLNNVMDYYVVGIDYFNTCTDEFLNGGIIPYDSSNPSATTLVSLISYT
jgi:hypothetical protein